MRAGPRIDSVGAAFFDFDGLLIDSESPSYAEWRRTFALFRIDLTLEAWSVVVGTAQTSPFAELQRAVGEPLDPAIERETDERAERLCDSEELLPGVAALLQAYDDAGVRRAVVSSSTEQWVRHHLDRLECDGWAAVECADLAPQLSKPSPHLYTNALRLFGADPRAAIAFEDSINGVHAAKAAGIFTVAVPNPITAGHDFAAADLLLSSLADFAARSG
jgi:HAD superfamily hydrolase (TIGR01509 family)